MARETKATVIKLVEEDKDLLKELVRETVQQVLETEMTEALGAAKSQRTGGRRGYRSGYYERSLVTRVGKLELRVPQDRDGHFSTELFERYSRVERAFVGSSGRDVRARSLDEEGQGGDRRALRPRVLSVGRQSVEREDGRDAATIRGAASRRGIPLRDARRPIRARARRRHRAEAGGAHRHRSESRWTALRARGRPGQS